MSDLFTLWLYLADSNFESSILLVLCDECTVQVAKVAVKHKVPNVQVQMSAPSGSGPEPYSLAAGKKVSQVGIHET